MKRQVIKDSDWNIIGYIDWLDDGRQRAVSADEQVLGYYDPRANETQDADHRVLASANVLLKELICKGEDGARATAAPADRPAVVGSEQVQAPA